MLSRRARVIDPHCGMRLRRYVAFLRNTTARRARVCVYARLYIIVRVYIFMCVCVCVRECVFLRTCVYGRRGDFMVDTHKLLMTAGTARTLRDNN